MAGKITSNTLVPMGLVGGIVVAVLTLAGYATATYATKGELDATKGEIKAVAEDLAYHKKTEGAMLWDMAQALQSMCESQFRDEPTRLQGCRIRRPE
jgi:hypothetical protein